MTKLWAIWGDDRDYDSGSEWIAGIYASEEDALADVVVLNDLVTQYKTMLQKTLRDSIQISQIFDVEEHLRKIRRIDENGGGCDLCEVHYTVAILVDNNIRSDAIGDEPKEETEKHLAAKVADIKSKLTEEARVDLMNFYNDQPFRGMGINGVLIPERQEGIQILEKEKLIVITYKNKKEYPYKITKLGKTVAASISEGES
jgi:hypothetical protein